MRVASCEFIKSALRPEQYPRDGRPEFAFVGRSNVGKSSLLNTLLNRKGLAKTSATPGKTQMVNFFEVNKRFYFVDLPGYGYAKVPKGMKHAWETFMTDYLRNRKPLKLVVQLVDARHEPTEKDADMLALLDEAGVPVVIAATKIDKLTKNQRKPSLDAIRKTLELPEDAAIIPFSAVSGEGKQDLWHVIQEVLEGAVWGE